MKFQSTSKDFKKFTRKGRQNQNSNSEFKYGELNNFISSGFVPSFGFILVSLAEKDIKERFHESYLVSVDSKISLIVLVIFHNYYPHRSNQGNKARMEGEADKSQALISMDYAYVLIENKLRLFNFHFRHTTVSVQKSSKKFLFESCFFCFLSISYDQFLDLEISKIR